MEVDEQLAAQVAGIDLVVLTPFPSLPTAIRRTDVAEYPTKRQLSIQRLT